MIRTRVSVTMLVLLTLLTTPASAQQGIIGVDGEAIGLIAMPHVRKDLQLDEGQAEKADVAVKVAMTKIQGLGKANKELDQASRADALRAGKIQIAGAYRKELASFLKPEQLKRLRAITIHQIGWGVFEGTTVRDELKLNDEQRAKIDAILADMRKEMMATSILLRDPETRKTAFERAGTLNARILADIVGVMDEVQRRQWHAMQGPPLR